MSNKNSAINVSITFRHTDSTEALKNYSTEKLLHCVRKYIKHEAEVNVVLTVEKRDHIAEVNLHGKGFDASAKSISDNLYAAIDGVVDTIDAQLRKQKERSVEQKHHSASY